jgi:hypothetical protein
MHLKHKNETIVEYHRHSTTMERKLNGLSFRSGVTGFLTIHKARSSITGTLALDALVPTIMDRLALTTDAPLQTEHSPNGQPLRFASFRPPYNHDNNILSMPADKFFTSLDAAIPTILDMPVPRVPTLDVPASIAFKGVPLRTPGFITSGPSNPHDPGPLTDCTEYPYATLTYLAFCAITNYAFIDFLRTPPRSPSIVYIVS